MSSFRRKVLLEREVQTTVGFVDIDLEREISSVARDVEAIIDSHPSTDLLLNAHKCEIMAKNFEIIDKFTVWRTSRELPWWTWLYLKHRSSKDERLTMTCKDKIATLEWSIACLSKLQSHDTLCLLVSDTQTALHLTEITMHQQPSSTRARQVT